MVGTTLGNYRIEALLGAGGMARVYRARHVHLDRPAAVKVLHEHLADRPGVRERVLREARAIASMSDPRIVQVHDVAFEGDVCYMAMELLEGESLEERLGALAAAGQRLPLPEALRVVIEVGRALEFAHEQGIAHRDVKPSNVMLTRDGRVVLMDFGLADVIDETRLTLAESVAGTPSYMSPEQARGERGDSRSDIYTLGILLYQLVAGKPPFEADTVYGLMQKHVQEEPEPLELVVPEVPVGLAQVARRAHAKQPDDRFQRVGEIVRELETLTGAESPLPSGADATRVGPATRPTPAASTSGDSTSPTAAGAAPVADIAQSDASGRPAGETHGSRVAQILGGLAVVALLVAAVVIWRAGAGAGAATDADAAGPRVAGEEEAVPSMATKTVPDDNVPSMAAEPEEVVPSMAADPGFVEEFSDNRRSWRLSEGSITRQIAAGTFRFGISEANRAAMTHAAAAGPYGDFVYTATARLLEGRPETGYGLLFRRQEGGDGYVFAINGLGQWSIWILGDGAWRELRGEASEWTATEAIRTDGEANTLSVEAIGAELRLSVNGQLLGAVTDEGLGKGGVGLYVATTRSADDAAALVEFTGAEVAAVAVLAPEGR